MDRLIAAKVFIDVAHSGSFSATADRLNMSRAMVSRYIETMENWLKTRLLHRTTRKVSLTTAGEAYLINIQQWLEQGEHLSTIALPKAALSGTIRVATSVSFSQSQLIPAIKPFIQQNPLINIELDLSDVAANLTEKQIDLAIRIAANPDPSLIGKPIGVCKSAIVASVDYIHNNADINQPNDLVNHDYLAHKHFANHILHLRKKEMFESISLNSRLCANEATSLLSAVLNGFGVTVLPTYLVNSYIARGELIHILPNWQPDELNIYALYSSRKHLSPAIRALIDHLDNYFKTTPW
ncbi:LysR family transcriptional regulator [Pseudoalteromonas sp. Ld20]|uniref:LysR family transcriptional regulator n=1 Tax=Pseudoalteromonas sp. Ld20 TaxID=649165 RepID=UPI00386DB529